MRRVDPKVYTKEYYLTDCTGFEEFKKSAGNLLEPRLAEVAKYLEINHNSKILDVGCGRGEMVIHCAKKGAEVYGIDYSPEGIKLANENLKKQPKAIKNKIKFIKMDAKILNFESSYFDYVILTDVVEHLYDWELDEMFNEIKRVLKKDGVIIMHTAPNKIFNDFGYKYYSYPVGTFIVRFWNLLLNRNYPNISDPKKLRSDSHLIMHINEPTYFSLRNFFKKYKFKGAIRSSNITAKKPEIGFYDRVFNLLVYFHPFSKRFPLNVCFGSDYICVLKNKK